MLRQPPSARLFPCAPLCRPLPAEPPEQAEPFADVLRDLDAVLLPGVTHWQSPRFFAYFASTGSDPGVLAELLTDRKSTRLNSSHANISYAVFCLKKKSRSRE